MSRERRRRKKERRGSGGDGWWITDLIFDLLSVVFRIFD